jgi:hypothetical protein
MNAYEKIMELEEKKFKRITGVTRAAFEGMIEVLRVQYRKDHAEGGQPGLPVELRLTLALEYWREYRTYDHMSNAHQIPKSVINRAVLWVEDTLIKSEEFNLPELKERFKSEENKVTAVIVDVTEQPIERPIRDQEASYSGKKNDIPRNTSL